MPELTATIVEYPNLLRAFQRVESSRGMAGVDGVSLSSFRRRLRENLVELGADLISHAYRPLPLLRVLVAMRCGRPLPYFTPTVRDRTAQAAVSNVLEPVLEALYQGDRCSCRKTGCVRHAANQVEQLHANGYEYVVNAGLGNFFDHVAHELLLGRVRNALEEQGAVKWIEQWVRAEVYCGESVFRLERGIPRGTAISPLLSILVLDVLDEVLRMEGRQMVRYGTDLVVLARTPAMGQDGLKITPETLSFLALKSDPEDPRTGDFWKDLEMGGLLFAGDGLLAPLQRPPRLGRILHAPPPLNLERYLLSRT